MSDNLIRNYAEANNLDNNPHTNFAQTILENDVAIDQNQLTESMNEMMLEEFKENVKAMPALIPEKEAFGIPVYQSAWNWNEEEMERIKKVQSTTKLEDVIKKDVEIEETEVEEVQQKPGLGVDQFY